MGKYLITGIAVCDVCGDRTGIKIPNGVQTLVCKRSHIRIPMAGVEEIAEEAMLDYLSREQNYLPPPSDEDGAELIEVRSQLEEARADHDALASAGISLQLAAKREPAILARIERLESRMRQLQLPPELSGPLAPGPDIRARWAVASMASKRAIAARLLSPDHIGELRILRAPHQGKNQPPAEERMRFRLK